MLLLPSLPNMVVSFAHYARRANNSIPKVTCTNMHYCILLQKEELTKVHAEENKLKKLHNSHLTFKCSFIYVACKDFFFIGKTKQKLSFKITRREGGFYASAVSTNFIDFCHQNAFCASPLQYCRLDFCGQSVFCVLPL